MQREVEMNLLDQVRILQNYMIWKTNENIKIVKYHIYNFVAFRWVENQMRLDLLVCRRGAARNGSLALIKALRLAGSLHQLKVDYFAPMWVRIILQR